MLKEAGVGTAGVGASDTTRPGARSSDVVAWPVAKCRACGSPSPWVLSAFDVNRGGSDESFDYYRCNRCKLLFLFPIPVDLGAYYGDSYYGVPQSLQTLRRYAMGQGHKLDLLRRFCLGSHLLEIGPSFGSFAYRAIMSGFEVEAIERDGNCCRFLNDVVGAKAVQHDDPVAALDRMGVFDVVVLWQVLEHLAEPFPLLRAISEHLVDGGILALSTPNPEALQFKLMGRWWPHLDAPRHLNLVPCRLLLSECEGYGFEPLEVTSSDAESRNWTRYGWQVAAMNLRGPRHGVPQVNDFRDFALKCLGHLAAIALQPLEQSGLRGSSYTAVFRKTRSKSRMAVES